MAVSRPLAGKYRESGLPLRCRPDTESRCACRSHLTEREIDILILSSTGLSARQVGLSLNISRRTVEYHFAQMLKRTGARTAVELVARCYADGILATDTWPPQWSGRLCHRPQS
jgi:DNA-binding NarL/FixJ family response regulator